MKTETLKTYSVGYRRCRGGLFMVHSVKAVDFMDAVQVITNVSADSGPVITFIIELPSDLPTI